MGGSLSGYRWSSAAHFMKTIEIPKMSHIRRQSRAKVLTVLDLILRWPATNWVLMGFFTTFFVYFIVPTFLNAYHELRLFPYFPELKPLGADLHEYLKFSRMLIDTGTPYTPPNYYPPFQAVFFLRFMYSGPDQSYIYLTLLSFISFLAITWLYPMLVAKERRLNPMAVFGLITGLISYGLWFELERGQFDLLVMAMCYAGIYLYHFRPRWRLAAYLLFILSVNIKIYPVIFVLCFTTDWHDWVRNLRRWGLLLLANFAGLFILGWKVFLDFINALVGEVNQPSYYWSGNHSIDSFVRVMLETFKKSSPAVYDIIHPNIRWIELALLLLYLLCLGMVLRIAYLQRLSAANPYLIMLLTIGTLVIPSTSHDYKLSIFIAPMVLILNNLELRRSSRIWLDLTAILLVVVLSTAYSSTLFMHVDLPVLLTNNMPALLVIAIASTLLLWVRSAQSRQMTPEIEFHDLA